MRSGWEEESRDKERPMLRVILHTRGWTESSPKPFNARMTAPLSGGPAVQGRVNS